MIFFQSDLVMKGKTPASIVVSAAVFLQQLSQAAARLVKEHMLSV